MTTISVPHRLGARWILLVLASLAQACSSGGSSAPPAPTAFTLHYHRALSDYAGWTVATTAGAAQSSIVSTTTDGFGAVYTVELSPGASSLAFSVKNGATTDPAGALTVDLSGGARKAYVISGHPKALARDLPALPATGQVAVYYTRADTNYTGWGLHAWGDVVQETAWAVPLVPAGIDPELGAGFVVAVKPGGDRINVIVHQGDTKDPGPDMGWSRAALGDLVFITTGSSVVTTVPGNPSAIAIKGSAAHLLAPGSLAWDVTDPAAVSFELRTSLTAAVTATATDIVGGTVIPLTPRAGGLTPAEQALAPYLKTWRAFDVAVADQAAVTAALKGQLVAVARTADGKVFAATQLQTALTLDALYAYAGSLGVTFSAGTPTFALWAPTAQAVTLEVFDTDKSPLASVPLTEGALGVWSHTGPATWTGKFYRYALQVYHPLTGRVESPVTTDPYAVSLSTNGLFAQVVDLADTTLAPSGWAALVKPALEAPEDVVIYESHIRDFSAGDATVAADRRGKYLGFVTEAAATPSDGMAHLAALAAAGLTHIHLLPAFDIATVDEDPANRVDLGNQFADLCAKNTAVPVASCGLFAGKTIQQAMATFAGDSDQQQQIATWMHGLDSFNWGYDPFHYGAPEGSYASSPDGTEKVVEFRRMVQGLAEVGLRVVMDVVYNHTNASGLGAKSVLDQVVPGYYHRLNPTTGYVETSSCCANTATEHVMMRRLMVDTLVRWARDYKVDGFRFDLMGLHLKPDVLAARDALAALTPPVDGVDGSKIYLYGEGWDMSDMAGGIRGVPANQRNMAGTGIGTFNDRIRDAVRGGGPFDAAFVLRSQQGFSSGQYVDPNELATTTAADLTALLEGIDRIKVGMAGNLKDFRLVKATGAVVTGGGVGYNGAPTGYALDPQEVINYAGAHDNQILFDIIQAKLPTGTSMADRVRYLNLGLDVIGLGQGIPFFHMGDDMLRSKSMERDSYDSGDWFNRIDWSGQGTAWRSGLPNAGKDQGNWPLIQALYADASIAPGPAHIAAAAAHFQELLAVRKSSRLLRLTTREDVMSRVDFLNGGPAQVPGVIVMTITDGTCATADLDPARDGLVVIINADKVSHDMMVPGGAGAVLHPVLAASADPVVRTASVAGEVFTVPARTSAVFQLPQTGAPGTGLPCNTR
jgi:pullulanase